MTKSIAANDMPMNHGVEEPNHIIVWLDQNFCDPNGYRLLKKAFASCTDPRCETFTMLTDRDYYGLLGAEDPVTITFEGVGGLLCVFTVEDACLQFLERNQDKRVFFITSGTMGRNTVPKIVRTYRHLFTDPITNKAYPSIYILCYDIRFEMDWSDEYLDYLQIFDFDADLLERLTRDVAEYYIERGARFRQNNSLSDACQCFHWARRLWHNYDRMQQNIPSDSARYVRESSRIREINQLLEEIPFHQDDQETSDDDDVVEPCS